MKRALRVTGVAFFLFFCFFPAGTLFSQQFAVTKFKFETGFFKEDDELVESAALEAGAALALGSHFRLAAGIDISMENALDFFHANEDKKKAADLELAGVAFEFPFYAAGQFFTPALFSGNYSDLASGGLLLKTQRVALQKPLFAQRGPMAVFSDETETTGAGAAFLWRAGILPVAAAAYASWNAETTDPEFAVFAQAAGAGETLRWNVFAGVETGENDAEKDTAYVSAGFSAEAGADRFFSLYLQAQLLPFDVRQSGPLADKLERKAHFLVEPRFKGNAFYFSAAFFLSPVLQPKNIPYLDIYDDGQYIGVNTRFSYGDGVSSKKTGGFDVTVIKDTESGENASDDVLFCISPFYRMMLKGCAMTVSLSFNPDKMADFLSAGEINLHIEAAL